MILRATFLLAGLLSSPWAASAPPPEVSRAKDLYLGEAYYQAAQGNWLDAISRLDTELWQYHRLDDPKLDPLHYRVRQANFSTGDFELSWRMHQRAGRAFKAVLEGDVDEPIRNEAAFRLARIFMQQGDATSALAAIERIHGKVPEKIRTEERLLRGQVYLEVGRFDEAIRVYREIQGVKGYEGYATYNIGIALVQAGNEAAGLAELEKAGLLAVPAGDEPTLAIRDKANLLLGNRLISAGKPAEAKPYLDRVRLSGPFSNHALLSSGWADAAEAKYDRALVPWSILIQRNGTDKAVQEGLLGAPWAYSKLQLHGRAAQLYAMALKDFGTELGKLDASIASVREGRFLKALVRDEARLDRDWVVKLRELPGSPETWYLLDLMASNDFQESLQNYFDLEGIRRRLVAWNQSLDSFGEIIQLRARYYEGVLPPVDARFKALDSQRRLRMEQRQTLNERLQRLLVEPRPDFLQTADERVMREQLAQLAERAKGDPSEAGDALRRRIERLQGLLSYQIRTTYDERLTQAWVHLHELDADVASLDQTWTSFVRSRQAAAQAYKGYDRQLASLRRRVQDATTQVATLMARQGRILEAMAVQELEQRRNRLEDYQSQARFALAESYDRANQAQMQPQPQPQAPGQPAASAAPAPSPVPASTTSATPAPASSKAGASKAEEPAPEEDGDGADPQDPSGTTR